jgi:microcystin-dependent protein
MASKPAKTYLVLSLLLVCLTGRARAQPPSPFPVGTVLPIASILDDERRQALFKLGWILADGCELRQDDFRPLFGRIQLKYGQASDLHFRLPDLRGRTIIGTGTGKDQDTGQRLTARELGQQTGHETHTLSVSEMPSHTHAQLFDDDDGAAGGSNPDANGGARQLGTTGPTGGTQPHNIMQPSLAVHYFIFFGSSRLTKFPSGPSCRNE